MAGGSVLPEDRRLTEADFRAAVSVTLLRLSVAHGAGRLALDAGCSERTIRSARDGQASLSAPILFNLLARHPSALDELLARFGLKAVPLDGAPAPDPALMAAVADMTSAMALALADGRVDHRERQELASRARPLVEALARFVAEADLVRCEFGRVP